MARVPVLAAATVAAAVMLAGCDTDDQPEGSNATDSLLREYQPRYETVRNIVTGFASRLPKTSPATAACDRKVDPPFGYVAGAGPLSDPGNVELVMADQLTAPPTEESHGDYHTFSVVPGYLAHGLGLSRLPTPMSESRLMNFIGYSGSAPMVNTQEPEQRLKLLLDAGLGVRYLVAVRVVRYDPPSARPDGSVTVDAFVLDLTAGDMPCRFQATGTASAVITWDKSRMSAIEAVYRDIQTHLGIAVNDVLEHLDGRR
jgi:hypothetical protein